MDTDKDWMYKSNTGMWTVLGPFIVTPKGEKKYLCRCDCGTERYVLERSLRYGGSKSCGCMMRKNATEKKNISYRENSSENLKFSIKQKRKNETVERGGCVNAPAATRLKFPELCSLPGEKHIAAVNPILIIIQWISQIGDFIA